MWLCFGELRNVRTVAHLSDLHFGRIDTAVLPALHVAIMTAQPDVIVVSGDLTQRARRREFQAARQFLDSLPFPRLVVPGNHDIPLYNLISRGLVPFGTYRRYFHNDLEPFYADEEIAILGVNTARALTFKNGRINRSQIEQSCARLDECGPHVTRIVVTHHPFDTPEAGHETDVIARAPVAMAAFGRCRVDLILSGHLHITHVRQSTVRYGNGYASLLVQAGTATSTRRRGEVNAFHLIHVDLPRLSVESLTWGRAGGCFRVTATERFEHTPAGWSPAFQREGTDQR